MIYLYSREECAEELKCDIAEAVEEWVEWQPSDQPLPSTVIVYRSKPMKASDHNLTEHIIESVEECLGESYTGE